MIASVAVIRPRYPAPAATDDRAAARVTLDIAFGGIAALTISPDGRYVTFSRRTRTRRLMLWLRPLDALEAEAARGDGECPVPVLSPDSASIAFFPRGYLSTMIDLFGGPAATLAPR